MLDSLFEKWFDKLKEIIKIDIKFDTLLNININSNNTSKPVEYNEETKLLSINYKNFSPTDKDKIRDILKQSQNEGTIFLLKESQELIKDIKLKEESVDVKLLLSFFINKIPLEDYKALRAAIYIDKRFEDGKSYQDIYNLKGDVGRIYGKRGLKICNLYASGYFESMIMPLYEEIENQGFDKNYFLKKYNIIINEEAFAIFVSGNMTRTEVETAIKIKIFRNMKYGIRNVTIHGMGRSNVAKIREAILNLEEETPILKKEIDETGNIILVKLSF